VAPLFFAIPTLSKCGRVENLFWRYVTCYYRCIRQDPTDLSFPSTVGGLFTCVHDLYGFNGLRSGRLEIYAELCDGDCDCFNLLSGSEYQGNSFCNPSDGDCVSLIGNDDWCCPKAASNNELECHLVRTGNCDNIAATNFAFDSSLQGCNGSLPQCSNQLPEYFCPDEGRNVGACNNIQEPHQGTVSFGMCEENTTQLPTQNPTKGPQPQTDPPSSPAISTDVPNTKLPMGDSTPNNAGVQPSTYDIVEKVVIPSIGLLLTGVIIYLTWLTWRTGKKAQEQNDEIQGIILIPYNPSETSLMTNIKRIRNGARIYTHDIGKLITVGGKKDEGREKNLQLVNL